MAGMKDSPILALMLTSITVHVQLLFNKSQICVRKDQGR